MNELKKTFIVFLILSISFCSDIDFQEIDSLVKTEFNVNEKQEAYFKYKLGETKGPIGLHFLLANLYTVQVFIYKSYDEEPILNYYFAQEQFKEIDTSDFDDYVYIVIKETYKYFYKDYITIYNPNEVIELKPDEPFTINNFLSNNLYQLKFSSSNNVTLVYNTLNLENSKRTITILNGNKTIVEDGEDSEYKLDLDAGEIYISVKNYLDKETDKETMAQDFSIIVYEKKNKYNFNKVIQNKISKNKYIYNNKKQTFYYYVNITDIKNSNTLNFKIHFKYYLYNNATFFSDIIHLDNKITESDLENNIPTENKLPLSYDDDSDEYMRIYFHDEKDDKKYKYLLVKLEIKENVYYVGSKDIEVSLGNEVENINLKKIEYNKATTINKKLLNDIPTYFKLVLNAEEKYLLTSQNQDLTIFIKGDLLNENNEINKNYLSDDNEIVVLSGIEELTIKIFGSSTSDIIFYVEKINKNQIRHVDTKRNNNIFEITMTEEECNSDNNLYVLGSFDYETYAYGELPVIYYATKESGEFEIYFKNKISLEKDGSLFPSEESQVQDFNKRIVLNTNLDLFTIKCKKPGTLSIRPEAKSFDETTHLIKQNSIKEILLYDHSEIVQLSTLLGQNNGIVYFSILSLDGEKINIIPDTPGVFQETSIENDKLFTAFADLSKYKMDELAIRVNCSKLEKSIEVSEIIHNKYNTYKQLKEGDNTKINLNNAYIQINKDVDKIKITIENLQNKNISYGVIKTANNNASYLTVANNYPNTTNKEIKEKKKEIEISNIYYNNKDTKKPYLYLLVSVLEEEDNLEYNIKVEFPNEDDDDNTILIVFIALISAIVLGFIVLALYLCVVKKKANDENEEDDKVDKLYSQNARTEVDP